MRLYYVLVLAMLSLGIMITPGIPITNDDPGSDWQASHPPKNDDPGPGTQSSTHPPMNDDPGPGV